MTMPRDLVLVRHGESEGNVAMHEANAGDLSRFTDEFMTTPGHKWKLTPTGVAQAQAVGAWLRSEFQSVGGFDHHYASPYRRTRETAAHFGLTRSQPPHESVTWRLNRALRERSWGDIGSIPRNIFESRDEYAFNVRNRKNNPLYWAPPGGESNADVAENRVRNFLDTCHREASGQRVLVVGHGETMGDFRLVLERMSDEEYEAFTADPNEHIGNCAALHYSRFGPTEDDSTYLAWLRKASPELVGVDPTDPTHWRVHVSDWTPIVFTTYDNATLLHSVTNRWGPQG